MTILAYVFPGQGSQSVGMLSEVVSTHPEIRTTFDDASRVLGYDLWELTQHGPAEKLDNTVYTQPAILTASYALWKVSLAKGLPVPGILAGHSLGEYTALLCADAISFNDAVALVASRGRYMQDAVPAGEGALAAIVGLEDGAVIALCKNAVLPGEVLAPANFNSPGQVVIAGHAAAVDRAVEQAKAEGARLAKRLPVSVPSHCSLMKPAADKLKAELSTLTIKTPQLPVVSNVDVTVYETVDAIRDGLIRQLYMPVRWVETIQTFANKGVTQIAECGPGKVLAGLNKRINPSFELCNVVEML